MSGANQGANQAYPQTVNLDTAKAKAGDLQSQTSKAQGGNVNPTDPASKARVRSWAASTSACDVDGMRSLALLRFTAELCLSASCLEEDCAGNAKECSSPSVLLRALSLSDL